MGTNYYWHEKPPCATCERPFEAIHVGKSSAGWCFSLHVYPEDMINSLNDWRERWERAGSRILDEYGRPVTAQEMLREVTERSWERKGDDLTRAWYTSNHAQPGPNGLARHSISPGHCIGHGDGTWDLIVGEFS